ncbi:prolyl oligopeptidase family protein [Citrus sinensis]|uniref:Prolyl oligopeptidase family protein n=1 Tax=Citrus sinensis TaxID=2711 RepID=A0ACB8LFK7_CITSI|nr:prolyl oligopeptidase family protein [Citrus sinensis]
MAQTSLRTCRLELLPAISSALYRAGAHTLASSSPPPPVPKKIPYEASAHGLTWQDPYHWMKNTNDPDFINHLNHENSYAQASMSDTQTLQRTLFSEMKNRMPSKISTPPERWGPWLYYQYIPEGKEYPLLCRRLETEKSGWLQTVFHNVRGGFGKEEILLDWNEIAEKYGYVHVGTCRVSPDHNFLAYTIDTSGDEQFMLQIKDLRNQCIVPRLPVDGVVSLAVLCTKLGSDSTDDAPIFTEGDSGFCVDITSTKDGKFITVNSNSRASSEEDATNPLGGLRRVHKRVPGVQYFLEHHYGFFYILTNYPLSENEECSSGDYYLARCRAEKLYSANWQNIILPGEDISLQDMDIFDGHLVLFVSKKGVPMLCSIDLSINFECKYQMEIENLNPWFFPLPSSSCSIVPGSNHDFMSSVYRAVLSSPVMPDMIVDYDMSRQTFSIVQQEELRGTSDGAGLNSAACELETNEVIDTRNCEDNNYQNSGLQGWKVLSRLYSCERKEVVSHDGVKIPLTILYSRKAWLRDQSPGLLQAYGAYGEVLDKGWCTDRLCLLDRGWVVAFADVRGGGGGDSSWHKFGSGLYKRNSIHDLTSCGKYLVNEGYVCKDKLCAIGYSAGCLLVGAAINMYPKLFCAAILKVPFLDICNTMLDPSLPLTKLDYEEFGNPQIQSQFEYIRSYSPYDNIPSGVCHPSVLVTASFHDARQNHILCFLLFINTWTFILKTNTTGGHFGEGGRYSQCEETAYDYAFLMKICGD